MIPDCKPTPLFLLWVRQDRRLVLSNGSIAYPSEHASRTWTHPIECLSEDKIRSPGTWGGRWSPASLGSSWEYWWRRRRSIGRRRRKRSRIQNDKKKQIFVMMMMMMMVFVVLTLCFYNPVLRAIAVLYLSFLFATGRHWCLSRCLCQLGSTRANLDHQPMDPWKQRQKYHPQDMTRLEHGFGGWKLVIFQVKGVLGWLYDCTFFGCLV